MMQAAVEAAAQSGDRHVTFAFHEVAAGGDTPSMAGGFPFLRPPFGLPPQTAPPLPPSSTPAGLGTPLAGPFVPVSSRLPTPYSGRQQAGSQEEEEDEETTGAAATALAGSPSPALLGAGLATPFANGNRESLLAAQFALPETPADGGLSFAIAEGSRMEEGTPQ